MAERVEIIVTAKDNASQVMRGLTSSFGGLGSAIQMLTGGALLEELTSQFIEFGKESVKATVDYANEVRSLQLISGESAESTSRFLQVLDDYKISAQDAMTATKAMTKEGLTPNLQTLAKLSDEYLSITDTQERNEFVLKNLGKAGLQWVEVLNKGSKALLEQGEAIDESLILTQKAVDDARKYEIALDNWNDSVEALKISIGTQLLPVLTDFISGMNEGQRAAEIMREKGLNPANKASKEYRDALMQAKDESNKAADAFLKNADANRLVGEAAAKTEEQIKAEEEAIKALTKANQDELATLSNLQSEITGYREKEAGLKTEHDELIAKKQELVNQGYWPESQAIIDINNKLAENELAQQQNTATFQLETNTRILARAEELLSIDGLTTEEKNSLIERGLAMGVYTAEAVARMKEEEAAAYAMADAINNIPDGKEVDVLVKYISDLAGLAGGGGLGNPNRAGGGPVMAGTMYKVNETRTEYFKPSMSGTILPLGAGGNGGGSNITVVYSPMISMGDRSEVQSKLAPAIIEVIRKAKADKII